MLRRMILRVGAEWKLHLIVVAIVIISELIYIREIPLGFGVIVLLPMLYAFSIGALLNPNTVRRSIGALIQNREVRMAAPYINIAILPFMAKLGTISGPSIESIIQAGPALLLQELGNLGTVLLAFPIGIFLLGMRREIIGASFSIAREPNVGIISDRYGLDSKEGVGVLGVYVCGTLFGTIIFSVLTSLIASLNLFHPYALAMACGVGSNSMFAVCSSTLTSLFPDLEEQILAFSSASNALTGSTGLFVALFVALPLCEFLYRKFVWRSSPSNESGGNT